MLLGFFLTLIDELFIYLNQHAFDLNLDTSNYLVFTLSYMFTADHFFPIRTAYLPIFSLYVLVYLFMGTVKIVGIFTNLVRGSGANI
jgi:hypothetical protein